jgi:hypothetical protein
MTWEIAVDGKPRSHRDEKSIAIAAAQYLKSKNPNVPVTVRSRDRRDDRGEESHALGEVQCPLRSVCDRVAPVLRSAAWCQDRS